MSKNYYKTEEVPPLKKSLINKVEKQYGKDNPKTYATLWSIYKKMKNKEEAHDCDKIHPDMTHTEWEASQDTPPDEQIEDAPTNATGPAVAGTGSDVATWRRKKKKKKHKATYEIGRRPDPDLTISFDQNFMSRFVKATAALSEVDTFTIVAKSQQADGHTASADTTLVIGYTDMNTTRISLGVESDGSLQKNLTFSAKYLKDIFLANKETKSGSIEVSDRGILSTKFDNDGFVSDYYLLKISNIVI